ncbi:hypothetical protein H0H81_008787 [Sphagnurus paluster]|uniref:F-box domain-containing protein n=1 Tax=Sphagnurus paluster TaxID=117069 RepID=A0A9P7FQ10_9AGAR|nr:hypothetical protein H0H81_008787 [Sphagnurus paluster]
MYRTQLPPAYYTEIKPQYPIRKPRTRSPRLPLELIDTILEFLHEDERALRNCALVCRTFLISSRRQLYRTVHIRSELACYQLYDLLRPPRADIVRLIRQLFVYDTGWISDRSYLPILISELVERGALKTFSLSNDPRYGVSHKSLPCPFPAIRRLTNARNIESLALVDIPRLHPSASLPYAHSCIPPRPAYIHLHDMPKAAPAARLRSLELSAVSHAREFLHAVSPTLTRLRRLVLYAHTRSADIRDMWALVPESKYDTLRVLRIDDYDDCPSTHIYTPHLTRLPARLRMFTMYMHSPPSMLTQLAPLCTSGLPQTLQVLVLVTRWYAPSCAPPGRTVDKSTDAEATRALSQLDGMLARALRRSRCRVFFVQDRAPGCVCRRLGAYDLPALNATGAFQFTTVFSLREIEGWLRQLEQSVGV